MIRRPLDDTSPIFRLFEEQAATKQMQIEVVTIIGFLFVEGAHRGALGIGFLVIPQLHVVFDAITRADENDQESQDRRQPQQEERAPP